MSTPFNQNVSARGVPIRLFVDIDWNTDVAEKLVAASFRLKRFDILLRTIGRKAVTSVRKNIMEGRTPEGGKWPVLKNPRAPGHEQSDRPLFDSGKLYEDIRYSLGSENTVLVGHTRETWYGLLHQKGVAHSWDIYPRTRKTLRFWTAEGWRFAKHVTHPGIPERRFLGVRLGDLPDVPRIMGDWATHVFDPTKALGFSGEIE